jgi:hypothetical protein
MYRWRFWIVGCEQVVDGGRLAKTRRLNPIMDAKDLGKMLENDKARAYTLEELENVISP